MAWYNKQHRVITERTDLTPGTFNLFVQVCVQRRREVTAENKFALYERDQLFLARMPGAKRALSNASNHSLSFRAPTVIIFDHEPEWADAYARWISGKNPSDSTEWKHGVWLWFA